MHHNNRKELSVWFDKLKAVRVSATNASRVAEWIGGEVVPNGDGGSPLILLPTTRGDIAVKYGDYVAKDAEGRYRVVRVFGLDLDNEIEKKELA